MLNISRSKPYKKTTRRSTFKNSVTNHLFTKKNPYDEQAGNSNLETTYQAVFSPEKQENCAL